MLGTQKTDLEALRLKIAALETRPILAGSTAAPMVARGLLPLPAGTLTEVFADEPRDSGAALGFALGLARGVLSARRPALLILQLVGEAQEMGVPYGAGLSHFGLDPARVVLARPASIIELLWALEEAMACRAVGAVVADIGGTHKALDFTASRRLSLRAAAAGTSAFLVRYGQQREASASKFRWRVVPAVSGTKPFDARAPGLPRWQAVLEKGRLRPGGPVSAAGEDYALEWTRDGFAIADTGTAAATDGRPTLPRPQPAALGDGLSQAS